MSLYDLNTTDPWTILDEDDSAFYSSPDSQSADYVHYGDNHASMPAGDSRAHQVQTPPAQNQNMAVGSAGNQNPAVAIQRTAVQSDNHSIAGLMDFEYYQLPPVPEIPPENILDSNPQTESRPPSSVAPTGQYQLTAPEPRTALQQTPIVVRVVKRTRTKARDEETTRVLVPEAVNIIGNETINVHQQQIGLPVSSAQPPNAFQSTGSNNFVVFASLPQQQTLVPITTPQQQQQQQQNVTTSVSQKGVGVVDVPALTDMEGEYGFSVSVEEKERTTKSPMWLMSSITKKLYTNINKAVPFEIHLKKKVPRDQFRVRAVAVFSSPQFLRTNVTRCPNHASLADVTNHDFPYPAHVVRADHPGAQYEESPNGRLSVVVPLDILQDGSDYTPILIRFMCLGSCVGGINRRPIAIILTLENNAGQICGRKVIDVRVCACPTRDIRTDEQTLLNKGGKRRSSSFQEKSSLVVRKKPKFTEPKAEPQDDDQIYYIPVRGKKLHDFLLMTKDVYYRTHPEYALKYPDENTRFQMDDDSEDELKGSTLQKFAVGDSETINWDSGGDSPPRLSYNETTLDPLSETKHSSPLSKLTPNISISPSSIQLRLWGRDDHDGEVVNFSHGEGLEYTPIGKANSSDIIITSSQSASNCISSESVNSRPSVVQSQVIKNIDFMPKHIPVMQVQSYKPGGLTVKAKPVPALTRTIRNQNREDKSYRNKEKKNSRETFKYSIDHSENSSSQIAGEGYMSPGSPEMLAANVLVEGFKAKAITKP